MNKREYHKVVHRTFDYAGILFSLSGILSSVLIVLLADNPAASILFPIALLYVWNIKLSDISMIHIMMSMSVFLSCAALTMTHVVGIEHFLYSVPLIYTFIGFIMFFIAVLARHWKLRFSCIRAYILSSVCLFVILPPIVMLTGHSMLHGLAIGTIVLLESALVIIHINYLIVYCNYINPRLVFLKVIGS